MSGANNSGRPEVRPVLDYAAPVAPRSRSLTDLFTAEVARSAVAGALMLGLACTALGLNGSLSAYSIDKTAAAVSVKMHWGYAWVGYLAVGLAVGATFGTLVGLAVRTVTPRRGAAALLAVGAIGGLAAGATWGEAVARERGFEVRAQPPQTKAVPVPTGHAFSLVNGPVRVHGTVSRPMNYPLLAFLVVAGATLGALAARGLADLPLASIGLRDEGDEGWAAGDAFIQREESRRAA
jgi:hypothetical protein